MPNFMTGGFQRYKFQMDGNTLLLSSKSTDENYRIGKQVLPDSRSIKLGRSSCEFSSFSAESRHAKRPNTPHQTDERQQCFWLSSLVVVSRTSASFTNVLEQFAFLRD